MVRYYENEYAWYFVLGMDDFVILGEETSVTEQLYVMEYVCLTTLH